MSNILHSFLCQTDHWSFCKFLWPCHSIHSVDHVTRKGRNIISFDIPQLDSKININSLHWKSTMGSRKFVVSAQRRGFKGILKSNSSVDIKNPNSAILGLQGGRLPRVRMTDWVSISQMHLPTAIHCMEAFFSNLSTGVFQTCSGSLCCSIFLFKWINWCNINNGRLNNLWC